MKEDWPFVAGTWVVDYQVGVGGNHGCDYKQGSFPDRDKTLGSILGVVPLIVGTGLHQGPQSLISLGLNLSASEHVSSTRNEYQRPGSLVPPT